ncbi:peptide methionine sulfoxide reductase [Aquimarina sp. TRL1]|uniref:peptide methionine sulfoxide reductase n=1 Tax=Aquimarina sp. (strain TRL1) TaxID=2736252 RepID=UPI001589FA70|nr:peptide methionine sulfoxide reductase [Aquimarina sp. TRL1]QKX06950.1 peptide methionine sulfoxide reductase [Aquimarina sp. TRL1]
MNNSILDKIQDIPIGYSVGIYKNRKYSIIRTDFNDGRSSKIYARELKGNDFISLNYYQTTKRDLIKPCEMPLEKVLLFLKNIQIV